MYVCECVNVGVTVSVCACVQGCVVNRREYVCECVLKSVNPWMCVRECTCDCTRVRAREPGAGLLLSLPSCRWAPLCSSFTLPSSPALAL